MGLLDDIRLNQATTRITDEAIHAEVLREIEAGIRRDGLWAKALAESNGSEHNSKAKYITLRVQAFKDELTVAKRVAQEQAEKVRNQVEQTRKLEIERAEEESKRQKKLAERNERLREVAEEEADWNKKSPLSKRFYHFLRMIVWAGLFWFFGVVAVQEPEDYNYIQVVVLIALFGFLFYRSIRHFRLMIQANPKR